MKINSQLIITVLLIFSSVVFLYRDEGIFAFEEWLIFKNSSLPVVYNSGIDLKQVERNLRQRHFFNDLKGKYSNPAYDVEQRVSFRLEAIFSRVKEILGMYPQMPYPKIVIYKNRDELSREYTRLFKVPGRYKSFYIHKLKTIFTSEQDISDSVIAHEFGHAVIDNYYNIVPPKKTSELLATYVDTHLDN